LHKRIGKFKVIEELFTYLAVAEIRQFFAVFTPYTLTKCTQELYTVFPFDIMLRTAGGSNCFIALFLGKTDITISKCKRLVIYENSKPVRIRSPDASYWIYCLSTNQRFTVQGQEI